MIRNLVQADYDQVISIVNENWKQQYAGYVASSLLNETGCHERTEKMKREFISGHFQEYVWEENGEAVALLSIGPTADVDKPDAFEIWRVYVSYDEQGKGIGKRLLDFGEQKAIESGYQEIVIWAFRENHKAISFYRRNGYVLDQEVYLDEPYHAWGVRLVKEIGSAGYF